MTLARETSLRLQIAGIKPDDPGLVFIREWNAAAAARARLRREERRAAVATVRARLQGVRRADQYR
jgi:hypothetical protein